MDASLAGLTAQPRPLTVDGRTYQVHPLTLSDFGELQAWVDRQFPDPIALANAAIQAGSYTAMQQQFLYRSALEIAAKGGHPIGTPEADDLVRGVQGTKQVLRISIAKGDPSFGETQADALYEKMTIADLARIFEVTETDRVLSDPKA